MSVICIKSFGAKLEALVKDVIDYANIIAYKTLAINKKVIYRIQKICYT